MNINDDMNALLAFGTLSRPLTPQKLLRCFANHGIGQCAAFPKIPTGFMSLDHPNTYFDLEATSPRDEQMVKRIGDACFSPNTTPSGFRVVTTKDREFADALKPIELLHANINRFLENVVQGVLNIDFINNHTNEIYKGSSFYIETKGWNIELKVLGVQPNILPLEIFIEQRLILQPLFRGEAAYFQRIKKCEQCGTYFLSQRETARFCKPACRVKFSRSKTM